MKILCLIPARKNSNRVKNKNFVKINGKSLVDRALSIAKKIKKFNKIVISTDNKQFLKLNKDYSNIIFLNRPKDISKNETKMSEVIKHTLKYFKDKNELFDAIVILQPTSPFRRISTINKAISKFKNFYPDYLASVSFLKKNQSPKMILKKKNRNFFQKMKFEYNDKNEKFYYLDGGVIFIHKVPNKNYELKGKGLFINVKFPENIDINDMDDLKITKKFI